MSILEADHARIVAEATAEARAAERRHWEARFRNAEQAHAAALAEEVQTHLDSLDILRAEHAAALAEAYTLMGAAVENAIEAEQPRTITADGPEPAVGSVVLGRYEISGQRVMDDDEETTIWRFSDGGWCYEWATVQRMYGPVTLIHDGGAA